MIGIKTRNECRGRGITLPEMLVVLSIIGLAVTVAVPLIVDAVRAARVRAAADEYVVSLMAARMLAVTRQATLEFHVSVDPANSYQYTDLRGKLRTTTMPDGVRITSATSPIEFRANGTVDGGASARIETTRRDGSSDIWEVETSMLGVSTVSHRREEP